MNDGFEYDVFGLRVRSEIALPELFPADAPGPPDVVIRNERLLANETSGGITADGNAFLLNVPDVAHYRISGGREIIVDAAAGVPDRNVRLFLLGSAFGALLHQRGLLPLHANAVEIDGRAFAFMGEAGAGKSTLAAWFHDQGHRIIADDVCAVGFDGSGQPFAAPGLPRLRLWAQALEATARDPAIYDRSYVGAAEQDEKFDVPLTSVAAVRSPMLLAGLYVLERSDEPAITALRGMDAAQAVFAQTYRGSFLQAVGGEQRHWESAVRLVRNIPVYRAERRWDIASFNEQCGALLEHAAGLARRSAQDALGAALPSA